MPPEPITVRPIETDAEVAAFYHLAAATFVRHQPPEVAGPNWRRYIESDPRAEQIALCGAFRGDTLLGGCIVYDRLLRLPPAVLRVACIGAVVTAEEYRKQGVARAVLDDVTARAVDTGCALLLLDGIGDFYHQWGFVDVVDNPVHSIERAHIHELPPSRCALRAATVEDAPAMLALYRRHHAVYGGSFERTLEQQQHHLHHQDSESPAMLIVGPSGEAQGYFQTGPHMRYGLEIAADTWDAALAALHYHARLLDGVEDPPPVIKWILPLGSPLFYRIADHLSMLSEIRNHRNQGWMARPANLPSLFEALVPRWSENWRRARLAWSGTLALEVKGQSTSLELSAEGARQVAPLHSHPSIRLTEGVFTQLLWGFRPVSWALTQPGQHIPPEFGPVLDALFPPTQAWIPSSDSF